jgi:hypothetical protein
MRASDVPLVIRMSEEAEADGPLRPSGEASNEVASRRVLVMGMMAVLIFLPAPPLAVHVDDAVDLAFTPRLGFLVAVEPLLEKALLVVRYHAGARDPVAEYPASPDDRPNRSVDAVVIADPAAKLVTPCQFHVWT